jgi:tRNA G18 (ribose-2'-O)-methylase SpoU
MEKRCLNIHLLIPTEKAKCFKIPVSILLFNLTGEINIGMVIRTASVMGCSKVYVVGRKKFDKRTTVGAEHYIDIEYITEGVSGADHNKTIQEFDINIFCKEKNIHPILIEQGGENIEDYSFREYIRGDKHPCFVFGSESDGLPKHILDLGRMGLCPILSIPQLGPMRSLNVSNATSIVIYEYIRKYKKFNSY